MTLFILAMITLFPFILTFLAYSLTDGFVFSESNELSKNETLELINLNDSLQLCFDTI